MPQPSGDTSLAEAYVKVLQDKPEAVFVITDGYENAPAGRFDEAVRLVKKIGNNTPVFQITPVMASEVQGTRQLSKEVSVMPISNPASLGLPLLKGLIEKDLKRGVVGLLKRTLPYIEG